MRQASEKERRDALEAQSKRENQQPYATELDDRDHEQAKTSESAPEKQRPREKPRAQT
ncbi:hypothetical protein SAMN06265338_106101 [Rhodoblastus acidophilus]|uniref:Uncharacterized protein n=1 Tax=Rhodoblastus acidophilus TaxID=1074 RepID=A0A212RPW5_RHOAC|nr:hypothetical protein [Rhodoblastus acidophilus]MCW2316165.1 hypothetical protein [Rhodoblastus acidophilus]SNB74597.1 hypothetical protein SAMN06265338_106101 [Rhodoblastus acidophilus]